MSDDKNRGSGQGQKDTGGFKPTNEGVKIGNVDGGLQSHGNQPPPSQNNGGKK